jgi:hypothetical protein
MSKKYKFTVSKGTVVAPGYRPCLGCRGAAQEGQPGVYSTLQQLCAGKVDLTAHRRRIAERPDNVGAAADAGILGAGPAAGVARARVLVREALLAVT